MCSLEPRIRVDSFSVRAENSVTKGLPCRCGELLVFKSFLCLSVYIITLLLFIFLHRIKVESGTVGLKFRVKGQPAQCGKDYTPLNYFLLSVYERSHSVCPIDHHQAQCALIAFIQGALVLPHANHWLADNGDGHLGVCENCPGLWVIATTSRRTAKRGGHCKLIAE